MKHFASTNVLLFALAASLPQAAGAAMATYTDPTVFLSAAGPTAMESFESVPATPRGTAAILTPSFTVTPVAAHIGVQTGPDLPETGYGAHAIDGSHYLFSYSLNAPPGTLVFDLPVPVRGFGFSVVDLGETDGRLTLTANAGDAASGLTAGSWPPTVGNGSVLFFGFIQPAPFTRVSLEATGIDEAFGVDQVYLAPVPLPPALLLFASGSLLAAALGRRRAG